jgi:hypothetical protein
MEKFKADHKAVSLAWLRTMYPNQSNASLEAEYYKSVTRVKAAGLICVAGLVGYFAGKRK